MAGLSYRDVAYVYRLVEATHIAVWTWVQRLRGLVFRSKPRARRMVAVNEAILKVAGRRFYVWAAVDVDSREVFAIGAGFQRMDLDAYAFLKGVLEACRNRPLFLVDGGPRYTNALGRLGLRWRHITWGMRSRVERWLGTLKARTRRFCNTFPVRQWQGAIQRVELWLRLFTLWYNWVRPHQSLGRPPSRR